MKTLISNYRRALRLPQVSERTGISKTQIYRLMQRGEFPLPARLSERVVAWDEDLISDWLSNRFAKAGDIHA
jgi:prophage regulatory protein